MLETHRDKTMKNNGDQLTLDKNKQRQMLEKSIT